MFRCRTNPQPFSARKRRSGVGRRLGKRCHGTNFRLCSPGNRKSNHAHRKLRTRFRCVPRPAAVNCARVRFHVMQELRSARCAERRNLRLGTRARSNSGPFRRFPHWHAVRLTPANGPALHDLRTAVSREPSGDQLRIILKGNLAGMLRSAHQNKRPSRPTTFWTKYCCLRGRD